LLYFSVDGSLRRIDISLRGDILVVRTRPLFGPDIIAGPPITALLHAERWTLNFVVWSQQQERSEKLSTGTSLGAKFGLQHLPYAPMSM
jgi:hypothetical protein